MIKLIGVSLFIRIERKEFARFVEGDIVGVAEADTDQIPLPSERICPSNPSAGRGTVRGMTTRIASRGKPLIFLPHRRHDGPIRGRQFRVIAGHEIERRPVGTQDHRMRPVLAEAIEGGEGVNGIESNRKPFTQPDWVSKGASAMPPPRRTSPGNDQTPAQLPTSQPLKLTSSKDDMTRRTDCGESVTLYSLNLIPAGLRLSLIKTALRAPRRLS